MSVATRSASNTSPAIPANDGLTMDATFATCSFDARTLGRGDLLGLFSIYGKA